MVQPDRRFGAAVRTGTTAREGIDEGLRAFMLEYGLLGIATAFFAVVAGTGAAWYVVSQVMALEFTAMAGVAASAALIALAVTLGLGLVGTWRILSVKAAPLLRNL